MEQQVWKHSILALGIVCGLMTTTDVSAATGYLTPEQDEAMQKAGLEYNRQYDLKHGYTNQRAVRRPVMQQQVQRPPMRQQQPAEQRLQPPPVRRPQLVRQQQQVAVRQQRPAQQQLMQQRAQQQRVQQQRMMQQQQAQRPQLVQKNAVNRQQMEAERQQAIRRQAAFRNQAPQVATPRQGSTTVRAAGQKMVNRSTAYTGNKNQVLVKPEWMRAQDPVYRDSLMQQLGMQYNLKMDNKGR